MTIPVTVHNPVKGIILMAVGDTTVESGTNVMITATAYDEKTDDDGNNAGTVVPGVTYVWSTSKASVATVDTGDSNMSPTIKTHSAGSAEIQAVIGDVKSNKVKISVFSVEAPERRLVASGQPYVTTFTPAVVADAAADPPVQEAPAVWGGNITITVFLQELRFSSTAGELRWENIAGTVDFLSLDMATLALEVDNDEATDQAGASVVITQEVDNDGQALANGDVIVRVSSEFADDIHVRVSLNATPAG